MIARNNDSKVREERITCEVNMDGGRDKDIGRESCASVFEVARQACEGKIRVPAQLARGERVIEIG